jgi:hypothetical protein
VEKGSQKCAVKIGEGTQRQAKECKKHRKGGIKKQARGYNKTYLEVLKTQAKRNTGVKR